MTATESSCEVPHLHIAPGDTCRGHWPANCDGPAFRIMADMVALGRGWLVFDLCLPGAHVSLDAFILISKDGETPATAAGNFNFVAAKEERALGWRCKIASHYWPYSNSDFVILLCHGIAPPLPEFALEFSGVQLEPLYDAEDVEHRAAYSSESFVAFLNFKGEALRLPTPELQKMHHLFYMVFKDIDGSMLSDEDRGGSSNSELIYGEVEFCSFWETLSRAIEPRPGEVFFDLGSGTGRAVFVAAMGFPWLRRSVGVEILGGLVSASRSALRHLEDLGSGAVARCAPMEFYQEDFLCHDWSDADIIWIASLCLKPSTLEALATRALELKDGARIITMHCGFGEGLSGFESVELDGHVQIPVEMNYGEPPVYVFRRKHLNSRNFSLSTLD